PSGPVVGNQEASGGGDACLTFAGAALRRTRRAALRRQPGDRQRRRGRLHRLGRGLDGGGVRALALRPQRRPVVAQLVDALEDVRQRAVPPLLRRGVEVGPGVPPPGELPPPGEAGGGAEEATADTDERANTVDRS